MEAPKQEIYNKYDFLFIGLGAANCLLILRLFDEGLLTNKTIAIIEPNSKTQNDRTFCFWATPQELVNLKLEKLVSYKWDNIEIGGITKQTIAPLQYFHVSGIDLYNQTKLILAKTNVTFFASLLTQNPKNISNYFELSLENQTLFAHKVFDSRPPVFLKPQKNQSHLLQSFYGFKVKSNENFFDPSTMIMMDFNVAQNSFTQFVYVLPYDEQTALIELTRFGENKLEVDEAKVILQQYIKKLNFSFDESTYFSVIV
jgi:lycopene beta-cyclase